MVKDKYSIINWAAQEVLGQQPTLDYWNDRSKESKKAFDIADGDIDKLCDYMKNRGFGKHLEKMLSEYAIALNGEWLSLASGVCFIEARLLRQNKNIEKIVCVELSRHRISELAPIILKHYGIEPWRVDLCFGSFYNVKTKENTFDVVLLCQAFHHAFEPFRLLKEIKRVLKHNGKVIIIGERFFSCRQVLSRTAKYIVKYILNYKNFRSNRIFFPSWRAIFPIDERKGDHHYSKKMYSQIFKKAGFSYKHSVLKSHRIQGFVLTAQNI